MTTEDMRQQVAVRNAIITQLHSCGMRPLEGSEAAILQWFTSRGVTATAPNGYLVLTQSDGSAAVPSSACETLRTECPHLFVPDPKRDAITSRADLERGTTLEIARAKSEFINKHGLAAFENLPRTKADAERRAVAPSPDMTAREYAQLSRSEKSRLIGAVGIDAITKIMARKG